MNVLVLGGGGQVARAVATGAPAGAVVIVKTRADLDIADEVQIAAAIKTCKPDWIVNGAAYTAVDRAESDAQAARLVNDTSVGNLVRAATAGGSRLLHLSTDFVFDGQANIAYRPGDRTRPLSIYGDTKLAGETQIRASEADAIILRTAWVYAESGRNFVLTMLRLMREKTEVRVVSDQIGAPTWATSIAEAIWGLIERSAAGGVYHWTDAGIATWYDFAVAIQDEALACGLLARAVPVIPIGTAEYPTPAHRPAFSVLDTASTRAVLERPAAHWRHNLRKMLDGLRTP